MIPGRGVKERGNRVGEAHVRVYTGCGVGKGCSLPWSLPKRQRLDAAVIYQLPVLIGTNVPTFAGLTSECPSENPQVYWHKEEQDPATAGASELLEQSAIAVADLKAGGRKWEASTIIRFFKHQ